ncbi:hypothetical protein RWV98_18235 [Agathobaculum sp. NTUH-O15-33]|uniref:hypothetical protein n=1 Tax=Agathobaculum sp. NTUH-O15-33 TaxID=3079302 RepID=UPI00295838A2|nr:hypothetical protein [Agathobaculum sp. NTUH-O15-33]WNX84488.1 hypothetical protein RWV98_18235 [Agathobaculum sp. NTUH-O15-33]
MADFVSHHMFGEQALHVFPTPAQKAAAKRPACFRWGCQGPDPLFYHRLLGGSPLHKTGNRMHAEKTDELFFTLSRAVHCLSGDAREVAEAYFYGFLCHYALDSEIHPYVYCRQMQYCSADAKLSPSAVHCQIEGDIDCKLYRAEKHEAVTAFEPEEYYALATDELAVLACLLHVALLRVYHENVPTKELRPAFGEMVKWQSFLYSNSRGVYRAASWIEDRLGRGALMTGHMKAGWPDWDCLNEEHDPWCNLWSPAEQRTDSVPELFGLARIRAAALAGQYAAQFDAGWFLHQAFDIPFDNGNPKRLAAQADTDFA